MQSLAEQHSVEYTQDIDHCVNQIITAVGSNIVLALPLGIGKANHVANALFRRAKNNASINLHIVTALSLEPPSSPNELGKQFLQPILDRIYGDYPQLEYAIARRSNTLPDNIKVSEFFLSPGALLNNSIAQQNYMSSNYTHAVRDLVNLGVNVLAQQVAPHPEANGHFSLSSNPDVTLDLMEQSRLQGNRLLTVAQVNQKLPYLHGQAEVDHNLFDLVLTGESDLDKPHSGNFTLFSIPQGPVSLTDYAIATHVTSLIKDGGTLQIGIGSMGDAIAHVMALRQHKNPVFQKLIDHTISADELSLRPDTPLQRGRFQHGLYANSEMLVEGILYLRKQGILKRWVYPDAKLQAALDKNEINTEINPGLIKQLVRLGILSIPLSLEHFKLLQTLDCIDRNIEWQGGDLLFPNGKVLKVTEQTLDNIASLAEHGSGKQLAGGYYCHAGFYIGSKYFYQQLRGMDSDSRRGLNMCSVSYTNQLYGDEHLKRAQRQDARFINTGMKVTLTGAVVSDGLEAYKVVSGVGGQYNFVAQAQELTGGRSIICINSTRVEARELQSNIVWEYSHATIPRHLRDIVVTEYGAADLRGLSDRDVIVRMLCIADSRFQPELVKQAKTKGKLEADFELPRAFTNNYPAKISDTLGSALFAGNFPHYPMGSDFTPEEMTLAIALKALKQTLGKYRGLVSMMIKGYKKRSLADTTFKAELDRMNLTAPKSLRNYCYRCLLIGALSGVDLSKRPLANPFHTDEAISEDNAAQSLEAKKPQSTVH